MPKKKDLIREIKKTGFRCSMCGECCTAQSKDSNLVILGIPEIVEIEKVTGMKRDEFVVPYPESFDVEGCSVTFAWCLKRDEKKCIFFDGQNKCTIYEHRPQICRTYPLMLAEDGLLVSECCSKGYEITDEEASMTADALIKRKETEDMEYNAIKKIYGSLDISKMKSCVIDSEGVKKIE
ncbi:Fe-S-cluster containining protein [Methanomicrobium sp. W14]|uniref:YkgJ family cysteine cluster protein n=1 Tax=Methanomicrobium sp. W14 TaxID=2817839 RepID=UPI001AE328F2|nr:YkgJ family cysteine cluster protein [Methanomicrobium sp. W14]MBP2133894.1 Fe-S-cluster containining protein [Methanomicrobium sp. W14]